MAIRALIFDFDGTLADTEAAVLQSWQEMFDSHGVPLPLDVWHTVIGTQNTAATMFALLREHVGEVDPEALRPAMRARVRELLADGGPREGVLAYLDEAATRGLALGVASSSSAGWVCGQLDRLGLAARFTSVATGDRHPAKPRPDTYLAVLRALAVPATEALAFEDSPHGVAAAKAAALTTVAVPNPITAPLDFGDADLVLPSFTATSLDELLTRFG
ncbi:HAD family hydrolase [Amycolatopsis jiangsuensis]|uniref:HAD superfamily hydrolase (TIGR01509 family) n=1 Tax=Amycolatopsis jiangsuensis TaxID=1181879 RepID=A0A840J1M1_9PSEU|nr:HAD-IA family hydrolase [Amycolatopsis jiangsuensis]MBB4688906.1 HAD superfamily hydrolase (TIGR01509 family) [Amycolatopsis jiangsuensis]